MHLGYVERRMRWPVVVLSVSLGGGSLAAGVVAERALADKRDLSALVWAAVGFLMLGAAARVSSTGEGAAR